MSAVDPVITFLVALLRANYESVISVDALSRDGTDMRGDAQNPKSFQAQRM